MKKQPTIDVHMPEDLFRQMLYLSEAEHRSPNNQILLLLRNSIAYYERTKGKMDKKKLESYDLTPYLTEEETEKTD